jgi:hypothetical protein
LSLGRFQDLLSKCRLHVGSGRCGGTTGEGKTGGSKKLVSRAEGDVHSNWVGFINTLLEYYLHLDPAKLTDEEWAEKFAQLKQIRKLESGKG